MAYRRRRFKRRYNRRYGGRWAGGKVDRRNPMRTIPGTKHRVLARTAGHNMFGGLSSTPGYGIVRQPFPPNLFTVFEFAETFSVTQGTTDIPEVITYRANSIYDPRNALGGEAVRYFNTLLGDNESNAPYRRYRVHASQINASIWMDGSAVSSGNGLVTILPRKSTINAVGSLDEMRVRPYSKMVTTAGIGSWKPYHVKNFIKMKTILGYKDLADSIETSGTYLSNPTDVVLWDINFCNVTDGGAVDMTCQVRIRYFVQLFNLVDVADATTLATTSTFAGPD